VESSQTHRTKRTIVAALLLALLPTLAACGWLSPESAHNNPVRLAVYRYERAARGKTDDLAISFNRTELRVKFEGQNENGGRTVWLFDLAAKEYFSLLPPGRTFLYIQPVQYNADYTAATVRVYRGDKSGYQGRELELKVNNNGEWAVTGDRELPPK